MTEQNENKPFLFSLGSGIDDEEDEDVDLIEIKLTSVTIQINSILFYKYSLLFRKNYLTKESREYLSDQIVQFQNQFGINEDNTVLFFKLIQKENVSITNSNYRDLRKLSEYFQVKKLIKLLDHYSQNYLSNVDSLIYQILEENQNEIQASSYIDDVCSEMEQKLSTKVNECLQNSQFEKLHISSIYRILLKSDKNTISSDALFDFINKSIYPRHVLFHFMKIGNLSDRYDMLYEIIKNSENPHFFYSNIPIDFTYLKTIRDENKILKAEKEQKQNENNQLAEQNSQLQSELEQLRNANDQSNSQNSELQSELEQLRNANDQSNSQNSQLQSELERLRNANDQSNSQNSQLQSELERLRNANTQSNSQNSELQSELERLRNEIGQLRIRNNQLQTEANNNRNKIELLNKLFHVVEINYNPLMPFQGIFSYLKRKLGGNISTVLQITASSTFSPKVVPQNVINYDEESKHFCSGNVENSWICFHFLNSAIIPTKYTIQPKKKKVYPINWVFEGSNDNSTWKNIDERVNCDLMAEYLKDHKAITFDIDENKSEKFKYIRIKMNGKNSGNNTYTLIIQAFEVYGSLVSV